MNDFTIYSLKSDARRIFIRKKETKSIENIHFLSETKYMDTHRIPIIITL